MTEDRKAHGAGLTRRRLIQGGGIAVAGSWLGLSPKVASAASGAGGGDAPAYLRRSGYRGLSTESFSVSLGGESRRLVLNAVADLPAAAVRPELVGNDDAFQLRFSGQTLPSFTQGMIAVEHPDLGSFPLFVVADNGSQPGYVAIVDRTVGAPSARAAASSPSGGAVPGASHPSIHHPPVAHRSAVQRATARRVAGGVQCELSLAPGADVASARVWLMHKDRPLGVASHRVHGSHPRFQIHTAHRPHSGRYDLVVTLIDRHGAETSSRRHLQLA